MGKAVRGSGGAKAARESGRGVLKQFAVAVALVAASPAKADQLSQWQPYIAEASARFGVPVGWIERVMRAESGGRTTLGGQAITSRAGAMGLMQLMPATWAEMRGTLSLGPDPHVPRDNILAGTAYLRMMYDRFGYPGLFAAYNGGPARYADHLSGRRALPAETRAYLTKVAGVESRSPVSANIRRPEGLFAVRRDAVSGVTAAGTGEPPSTLFAPLSSR